MLNDLYVYKFINQ